MFLKFSINSFNRIVLLKLLILSANGHLFSIPSLLPTIQERLLDYISMVLSKTHYRQEKPAVATPRVTPTNGPQQILEISSSALVQLALQTLARFNFKVCECEDHAYF